MKAHEVLEKIEKIKEKDNEKFKKVINFLEGFIFAQEGRVKNEK